MDKYILAIDQGTSGSRAVIYFLQDQGLQPVASGSASLHSHYPQSAYVEQDPQEILDSVQQAVRNCLASASLEPTKLSAAAISNQRETFVLWDEHGQALAPAIVWQCRRSIDICNEWLDWENDIHARTGLKVDPYFSASKLAKLLRENAAAAQALRQGRCRFGTVDSWLLYHLTGNYYCDSTNASRTMFFNIHTLSWDQDLLHRYQFDNLQLPEVRPSASFYGQSDFWGLLPNKIAIHAAIGDSHGAAVGHGCLQPGALKATLGTGCSVLLHIGQDPPATDAMGIQTLCFSTEQETHYATEGIIVSFGATTNWLREGLQLFEQFEATQAICQAHSSDGVAVLPAFSGMGAPFWKMQAKGAIHGLTLATTAAQVIRAGYESLGFQLYAIIRDMQQRFLGGQAAQHLSFDGGLVSNRFLMQFSADLFGQPIAVSRSGGMAARGAALLACHNAFGTPIGLAEKSEQFLADYRLRAKYLQLYQNWCSYLEVL